MIELLLTVPCVWVNSISNADKDILACTVIVDIQKDDWDKIKDNEVVISRDETGQIIISESGTNNHVVVHNMREQS